MAGARDRSTFGQRLADHQVIRHKLVDMAMRCNSTRAFLITTAAAVASTEDQRAGTDTTNSNSNSNNSSSSSSNTEHNGSNHDDKNSDSDSDTNNNNNLVAEICQLKNLATANLERVASDAVQVLGGMGYMEGTKSERVFRETKVMQIGGGSTEIMKDLAAKQARL